MYTVQLTKDERECIIAALLLFEMDEYTTKDSKQTAKQALAKICSSSE